MSTEIKKVESKSPAELIAAAVSQNTDLDKLEKLLQLQERWESNEAKKAYHKAMVAFKANPPKIEKDKKVSFATNKGKTEYSHASLANVTDKISKALSEQGLSASWRTKQNGQVIVTCQITHEMGHSEETSLSAPSDTSGVKNPIQAIASTISYLERYTLLALTGLATSEMDDDAQSITVKTGLTEEQERTLGEWLLAAEVTEKQFCSTMKISSISELTQARYQTALEALKKRVGSK